jgi:hypothetical protein
MSAFEGPNVVTNGLVLALDAANTKLKQGALFYRWFTTDGTNPSTKAGFDAFFNTTPQSSGIDENRTIDWLVVENRPSYITTLTSFAWEVTGFLIIEEPGNYVFNTRSDDGNELQINNQIVTSFYGGRGVPDPGDVSSAINLSVGEYQFRYRMQQGAGGAGAQVRWQRPSSNTYEVIPARNFGVGLNNNVFVDLSGNNNNGVLINGPTFNSSNLGSIVFDGVDDYVQAQTGSVVPSNNFTYESWCMPNATHEIDTESTSGFGGTSGQRYLIDPQNIAAPDSGAGVSVGTNGVSVYEHAPSYMPALLVSSMTISSTTMSHIVVVYNNKQPSLYVNGNFIKTGLTSPRTNVYGNFATIGANTAYGYFSGNISGMKVYNRALSAAEVQQNFNATRNRFGV